MNKRGGLEFPPEALAAIILMILIIIAAIAIWYDKIGTLLQ